MSITQLKWPTECNPFQRKYADNLNIYNRVERRLESGLLEDVPVGLIQKAAGIIRSGDFGSQGRHRPLTQ